MWLITKHGFYSIVEKEPGIFHVRARERADIENLLQGVPLPEVEILESNSNDYRYRVIVGKDEVLNIMRFFGDTIDYSNFKNKIAATPGQSHKHHAYGKIWSVLADALGAYGRSM